VANSDNRLRLVSDSDAHLRSIIANLEESRAALVESANPEAAQILAMAILQLRMRLHHVADSELKVLCQAVQIQEADRAKRAGELASKDSPVTKRVSRWPNSIK
jgi:signal transduction histidine kinase